MVVDFVFYALLTAEYLSLDVVHHLLELLVLLGEEGLLVRQRDQILLLGALNNVIHGHQPFLNLRHHALLTLQRHLFVSLVLLTEVPKLCLQVHFKLVFVLDSSFDLMTQLGFVVLKDLVG